MKPAKPAQGVGEVVGEVVEEEVEVVVVVVLRGEKERGSSRRVGEWEEKAVRSFWRDLRGERRRVEEGMIGCPFVFCCSFWWWESVCSGFVYAGALWDFGISPSAT